VRVRQLLHILLQGDGEYREHAAQVAIDALDQLSTVGQLAGKEVQVLKVYQGVLRDLEDTLRGHYAETQAAGEGAG
jgi:hypothetical protein